MAQIDKKFLLGSSTIEMHVGNAPGTSGTNPASPNTGEIEKLSSEQLRSRAKTAIVAMASNYGNWDSADAQLVNQVPFGHLTENEANLKRTELRNRSYNLNNPLLQEAMLCRDALMRRFGPYDEDGLTLTQQIEFYRGMINSK